MKAVSRVPEIIANLLQVGAAVEKSDGVWVENSKDCIFLHPDIEVWTLWGETTKCAQQRERFYL